MSIPRSGAQGPAPAAIPPRHWSSAATTPGRSGSTATSAPTWSAISSPWRRLATSSTSGGLRAASHRLGGLINQAEIGRDTRVPRATAQRYLDLLEASFQLIRLAPFSVNRTRRLIKGPKLYWSDPALAWWLGGTGPASGAHLENLVLGDLLVWRDGQVPAPEVLFWRTTTDREVDFVIESGDCYCRSRSRPPRTRGIPTPSAFETFRDEYPERFVGGLLLHGGSETQWLSDRILGVPWWRVL